MPRKRKKPSGQPSQQLLLFSPEEMAGVAPPVVVAEQPVVTREQDYPSTVDASLLSSILKELKNLDSNQLRLVAMQSAAQIQNGIDPQQTYILPTLPRRLFNGVELQAVAYISIIHSFPTMIDKLGLDFSKEYEEATNKK